MSDTFNFQRFGRYFRFDLARMWRNNTKTAVLLGCGSIITILLGGFGGLLLDFRWHTATDPFRFLGFFVCLAVLELLMAKTYGFVTDRKKGSDYLMTPASTFEKWLSMMLVCLVVIPLFFLVTYFIVDALVCLALPATGQPLFQWMAQGIDASREGFQSLNQAMAVKQLPLQYSLGSVVWPVIISASCNYLYFLLCGLVFKRHKILYAILVAMGFSMVLSLVAPHFMGGLAAQLESASDAEIITLSDRIFRVTTLITGALAACLAAGCYLRLRKLSH